MRYGQYRLLRGVTTALATLASLLLVAGAIAGWLLPRLAPFIPSLNWAGQHVTADTGGQQAYLGADITAISIVIGVVLGRSATPLITSGSYSSRKVLRELLAFVLFFLTCTLNLAVALMYLLFGPTYLLQFWQIFLWFCANLCFTLNYVWSSGLSSTQEYTLFRSTDILGRMPLLRWAGTRAYTTLSEAIGTSLADTDRDSTLFIQYFAGFLVWSSAIRGTQSSAQDPRSAYRALRYFVTVTTQNSAENVGRASGVQFFYLGFLVAAIMLRAIAEGVPADDPDFDLFAGLRRELRDDAEHFTVLCTGLRHGLYRGGLGADAEPLIVKYWAIARHWPPGDPRRTREVGRAIVAFLRQGGNATHDNESQNRDEHSPPAAHTQEGPDSTLEFLLEEQYRDIAEYLAPAVKSKRGHAQGSDPQYLIMELIDAIQTSAQKTSPEGTSGDRPN